MKLLLDTHALIWWQNGDPKLGPSARAIVADPVNSIWVSDASLWEVAIKVRTGKLRADFGVLQRSIRADGFRRQAITPAHIERVLTLPQLHRDPFDHLLIAQAIDEDATLLTADQAFASYPVRTIACQ